MSSFSVRDLGWLERPADDWRATLKALCTADGPVAGGDLLALARVALNIDQLIQLDRAVGKIGERLDAKRLTPLRVALMVDGTTDYLAPALRASGLRHGLSIETYAPDFGQALAEAMHPDGPLAAFKPEVALVASDYRSLGLAMPQMEGDASAISAAVQKLGQIAAGVARLGATPMLQTVPAPADPWLGHLDAGRAGSPTGQVAAVNARLREIAAKHGAPIFDADALAASVGRDAWQDDAYWHRAKLAFSPDLVPLWADHAARILGALRGKSRKCLVLDLDNTLWGGVIGDDGLDGIRLGQGSADGEAYLAIQRYALDLKKRGVVLAVVSKNEDDAARKPFREHPEMLLKEDDIAVFIANWTDKASNIAHVAKVLNIGTDALAFLDDNPAERARVRQMLPEVAVPEVGDDPSTYPRVLAQSGLFETVALSADDAKRAAQYAENAKRAAAMEEIGDYDDYLASLDMRCDLAPFDAVGRARIAQLVNKSNQFNLTTRRYTEADIAGFETNPGVFDLQVRLTDRFGDNGMISVVMFHKGREEWVCDTWLMSCRVLKRRVEEAVLASVVTAAREAGAKRLVGDYQPSEKNRMVAGHFESLGFVPAGETEGGGTRWVLDLDTYTLPDLPMHMTGPRAPNTPREAAE